MKQLYLLMVILVLISCGGGETTTSEIKSDPVDCVDEAVTVPDGESAIFYSTTKVSPEEQCSDYMMIRQCDSGILSGDEAYIYTNCEANTYQSCSGNYGTLNHGESLSFYNTQTVPYGESCGDHMVLKTCDNGILVEDQYSHTTCQMKAARSCTVGDTTLNHGDGTWFYSKKTGYYNEECSDFKQYRYCINGDLSGDDNYSYSSCSRGTTVKATAKYMIRLKPVDTHTGTDNSGNVIQGIAAFGNEWFVSQDAGNGYVLFNHLNSAGNSIENWQISYDSHGQDLSWRVDGKKITLYTVSGNDSGVAKYQISWSPREITLYQTKGLFANYDGITPTLSEDKNKLAIRGRSITDSTYHKIFLYKLSEVNSGNKTPYKSFKLDPGQSGGVNWFQGIVFRGDDIYCLTGDNKHDNPKRLYKYSASEGKLVAKYSVTAGYDAAKDDDSDGVVHYEPEGLTYKDGYLYFVMNSGESGKRIKRLYRVEAF